MTGDPNNIQFVTTVFTLLMAAALVAWALQYHFEDKG